MALVKNTLQIIIKWTSRCPSFSRSLWSLKHSCFILLYSFWIGEKSSGRRYTTTHWYFFVANECKFTNLSIESQDHGLERCLAWIIQHVLNWYPLKVVYVAKCHIFCTPFIILYIKCAFGTFYVALLTWSISLLLNNNIVTFNTERYNVHNTSVVWPAFFYQKWFILKMNQRVKPLDLILGQTNE